MARGDALLRPLVCEEVPRQGIERVWDRGGLEGCALVVQLLIGCIAASWDRERLESDWKRRCLGGVVPPAPSHERDNRS